MTPGAVASAQAAFSILANDNKLRLKLWENCMRLFEGLRAAGFSLGPEVSPTIALILSSPQIALQFWSKLIDSGIYTNAAIPPATPQGLSLLRVSVSAAHKAQQIEAALETIKNVGHELGIIGTSA